MLTHARAWVPGDVYYSRLSVMYTRAVQGIICAAGPCASQGLAHIIS